MKMYILIRDSVPLGHAMVAAAHASLAAYLSSNTPPKSPNGSLAPSTKAVCKVTDAEFDQAKSCPDYVLLTESSLGNQEVALAFRPRDEWPKSFKYFRLYR